MPVLDGKLAFTFSLREPFDSCPKDMAPPRKSGRLRHQGRDKNLTSSLLQECRLWKISEELSKQALTASAYLRNVLLTGVLTITYLAL